MKPQNLPEKLVWYYILGTYIIYFLGAQFVLAPLLGYFLVFYLIKQWWNQTEETPLEERIIIPLSTWVWIIAMLVIEVALIVGHLDFNFGLPAIIRASLSYWSRTWALFLIFPLAGSLNIRPQLIYRATCILCLQSLILIPVVYLVSPHLPSTLYVSPLRIFGGASFTYVVSDMLQGNRLNLFAPFSPALGLAVNICFWFVNQETNTRWKFIGRVSCVAVIVLTLSRLAIVCLPFTLTLVWLLTSFARPWVHFVAGFTSFLIGIFSITAINFLTMFEEFFNSNNVLRENAESSSKNRAIILRIGIERWQNEALIWGHGYHDAPIPKPLVRIPIGSHDTWSSLLYTYGLVGCGAFVVALGWSFVDLLIKAQSSKHAKAGLGIILTLLIFTFAVKLTNYSYIYWTGLLFLGIAFKEHQENPQIKYENQSQVTVIK